LRTGDRPRNGGQRFKGPPLVLEVMVAHRHAVFDTLVFPNEPGAGDRPGAGRLLAFDGIAAVQGLPEGA